MDASFLPAGRDTNETRFREISSLGQKLEELVNSQYHARGELEEFEY